MRTRLWATMRRPAFSITALIAPVRLRAVASGLMMEKVRSLAICRPGSFGITLRGLYPPGRRPASRGGERSGDAHPAFGREAFLRREAALIVHLARAGDPIA